jgi:hypothetical protein
MIKFIICHQFKILGQSLVLHGFKAVVLRLNLTLHFISYFREIFHMLDSAYQGELEPTYENGVQILIK